MIRLLLSEVADRIDRLILRAHGPDMWWLDNVGELVCATCRASWPCGPHFDAYDRRAARIARRF